MSSCFCVCAATISQRDRNVSGLDPRYVERICQLEEPYPKKKENQKKKKTWNLKIGDVLFIFFNLSAFLSICLSRLSFSFRDSVLKFGLQKMGVIIYQH